MGHKGYYGQYSGNSKFSKDHAHTRVTSGNYKATERDDAAHIDYLKRDIDYDNKHGHSDEKMTADEKHISKLAGDMKYDKEHHGSPAKNTEERVFKYNKKDAEIELDGAKLGRIPTARDSAYAARVVAPKRKDGKKVQDNYDFMKENYPGTKERPNIKYQAVGQMHCTGKRKK